MRRGRMPKDQRQPSRSRPAIQRHVCWCSRILSSEGLDDDAEVRSKRQNLVGDGGADAEISDHKVLMLMNGL
jgi:hypothetical protein